MSHGPAYLPKLVFNNPGGEGLVRDKAALSGTRGRRPSAEKKPAWCGLVIA